MLVTGIPHAAGVVKNKDGVVEGAFVWGLLVTLAADTVWGAISFRLIHYPLTDQVAIVDPEWATWNVDLPWFGLQVAVFTALYGVHLMRKKK